MYATCMSQAPVWQIASRRLKMCDTRCCLQQIQDVCYSGSVPCKQDSTVLQMKHMTPSVPQKSTSVGAQSIQ